MLIEHRGSTPVVAASAVVAPTAVISGDVTLGENVRVLHGAVLSAEDGLITVGDDVVIMEGALLRGRARHHVVVGSSVMIGPRAHVNGAEIGDGAFIATGASVFPGAVVGAGAEVRINAVVQVNTTLEPGAVVPIGWVAVGSPASILPPERHDEIWAIQRELGFVATVYGAAPDATMSDIMRGQAEFYGAHRDDRLLE
ncbi:MULTISPECIES: gamma carbonic anhydrase family protein [unclassified Leifsonia]|uniref:gamma carbonic anhydrase family protein n=1 Tax=unclassified Leifsonia TaxID=2663824 RepID=UPI0006FC1858|nr:MULTISPECIES: transferase [unclassified Leifsonia]KQX05201.1 transferase [Leifsonia sp. Root1293]KRA08834.1 transferase [Leifsonia sp. Root60]